mgnify:CR=1 FL=1
MQVKQINQNEFEEVVLKERHPVLVDFYADWCGPCQMLAPILDELAEDMGDQAVIVKVNVDENQRLAEQYQVMSIPKLLFFRDGKEIDAAVGFQTKEQLAQKLQWKH